jgi:hypothetical protein
MPIHSFLFSNACRFHAPTPRADVPALLSRFLLLLAFPSLLENLVASFMFLSCGSACIENVEAHAFSSPGTAPPLLDALHQRRVVFAPLPNESRSQAGKHASEISHTA